jgi:hypothetical protein
MYRRRGELDQRLHVLVGGVAFVLREAVAGVFRVEFHHHAVPRDLGDDRGGGDAETLALAGSYTSNGTTTTWVPLIDASGSTIALVNAASPQSTPATTYTYDPAGNPNGERCVEQLAVPVPGPREGAYRSGAAVLYRRGPIL